VHATRKPVLDLVLGVFRRRTQDRLWLQVSANPRWMPTGSLREIICTFGDITRRKHVELELIAGREALRESALHTQAILDNVVDAVITINRDGLIESFNRAATSIFGYRPVRSSATTCRC
jgi:PAS domain-containing protein